MKILFIFGGSCNGERLNVEKCDEWMGMCNWGFINVNDLWSKLGILSRWKIDIKKSWKVRGKKSY